MATIKITYNPATKLPTDQQFDQQYHVNIARSDGKPIHPQEVHAALRISLEVSATQLAQLSTRSALKLVK
jgi:hypothetical protein